MDKFEETYRRMIRSVSKMSRRLVSEQNTQDSPIVKASYWAYLEYGARSAAEATENGRMLGLDVKIDLSSPNSYGNPNDVTYPVIVTTTLDNKANLLKYFEDYLFIGNCENCDNWNIKNYYDLEIEVDGQPVDVFEFLGVEPVLEESARRHVSRRLAPQRRSFRR